MMLGIRVMMHGCKTRITEVSWAEIVVVAMEHQGHDGNRSMSDLNHPLPLLQAGPCALYKKRSARDQGCF